MKHPLADRIHGFSYEGLAQNLAAIQSRSIEIFQRLNEFILSHSFHVTQDGEGGFRIRIDSSWGESRLVQIPPPSQFSQFLINRYREYKTPRHGLVLLGVDAYLHEEIQKLPRSEFTPILWIEPDMGWFSAWAVIHTLESMLTLPQTFLFLGDHALQEWHDALDAELEPYFLTCDGFYLIPSLRMAQAKTPFSVAIQGIQLRYREKQREILSMQKRFAEFYGNPERIPTRQVLILEPAVTCWITLGRGLAQGFRDWGYRAIERQVSFPFSAIHAYESLQLLLLIERLCPDYLVTLSHPSDLVLRGIEMIPIPRLVWYVDRPDYLIQQDHGAFDFLFPVWKELGDSLQKRGGILSDEIPVGGMPIRCTRNDEFSCEVGFVGTIYDSSSLRSGFSIGLNQKLEWLLQEKRNSIRTSMEDIWESAGMGEEDCRELVEGLRDLRRPGMTDKQLIHFFLYRETMREVRLRILSRLQEFDLKIYGNADWQALLQGTALENAFQGRGLTTEECYSFYASAKISLSLHPTFPHGGPTLRDMDIPMSGGFVLSDMQHYIGNAVYSYFEPHEEIALFEGEEDIAEKVRFYLEHPEERERIREDGMQRIGRDHTYRKRVGKMIEFVDKKASI